MNLYFTSLNFDWLDAANRRGFMHKEGDEWVKNDPTSGTTQWGQFYQHPARDEWAVGVESEWITNPVKKAKFDELFPDLAANAKGPFTREVMEQDGWFTAQGGPP